MFIVSSTNQMAKYSPFYAHQAAASAYPAGDIDEEDADELGALQFMTHHSTNSSASNASPCSSLCEFNGNGSGSVGGLRRSVRSSCIALLNKEEIMLIDESDLSDSAPINCSHANHKNNCLVEARQVEMEFSTLSTQPFQLTVTAPNGESSSIYFTSYGDTKRFMPQSRGCGHGFWSFEISNASATPTPTTIKENIYLDGVGSLYFAVDEQMNIRLTAQEFLRLPSASAGCPNAVKKGNY